MVPASLSLFSWLARVYSHEHPPGFADTYGTVKHVPMCFCTHGLIVPDGLRAFEWIIEPRSDIDPKEMSVRGEHMIQCHNEE